MNDNSSYPKCIIFDCDGVLVDSEAITFGVLHEMCDERGLKMTHEELEDRFLGKSLQHIMQFIGAQTGGEGMAVFEPDFRVRTFARFQTDIQPVNGIIAILDDLLVARCVASSGPPHKIRMNLELTGLAHYFGDDIFSCYELKRWKPDPAIFLHAAKNMGFSPGHCVVVEDSPAGIKGAVAGGFRVFGLANAKNEGALAEAGAEVIHHLSELRQYLDVFRPS